MLANKLLVSFYQWEVLMAVQRAGIRKEGLLPVLESVGIFQQLESQHSILTFQHMQQSLIAAELAASQQSQHPHHLWFQQWLRPALFSMILYLVKPLPSFMSSEGLLTLPAAT